MIAGYPAVLRIVGRTCVVVGGGQVGGRKAAALVRAGAAVTVVAPEIVPSLASLLAAGGLRHKARAFEPADLDEAFLAVAATNCARVNREIADAARERGVLVNVADDPSRSDFTVPATVRRADITLAVSTGGRSPAFARYLREQLDEWLTDGRCLLLELLADVRKDVRAAGRQVDGTGWKRAIADRAVLDAVEAGDREGARRLIFASLMAGS